MIELLVPEHAGKRLTLDQALVVAEAMRSNRLIEFVGFPDARENTSSNAGPNMHSGGWLRTVRRNLTVAVLPPPMEAGSEPRPWFRRLSGLIGSFAPADDVVVDSVLDLAGGFPHSEEPLESWSHSP